MSLENEKIEKWKLKIAKERLKIIAKECRLLEKKLYLCRPDCNRNALMEQRKNQ